MLNGKLEFEGKEKAWLLAQFLIVDGCNIMSNGVSDLKFSMSE